MKLSILQISDLHRDAANPIRNDVLIQSLENDRARYSGSGDPKIPSPDIIVVTGDIIQGVWPGTPEPEARLAEQYDEALEFLGNLADRLLAGNRERIVIVPGNHDVSASDFMASVSPVDVQDGSKRQLIEQLFSSGSSLRWSWSDLGIFEIVDRNAYDQRMAAFAKFYGDFYQGARSYDLDPAKQFDVFALSEFGVAFVGFSSCHNNDIFNKTGTIHAACIAGASSELRQTRYDDLVRIGVWHHNTEGVPGQTDYMDPGTLQNLIDHGFSIGMHGHQHRPQFLDTRFRYGMDRRITVISAGTLCGHASFGHARAYNIVELDIESRKGRLHLREMQNNDLQNPIWNRRQPPAESKNFLDFEFDGPPPPLVDVDARTDALMQAQRLFLDAKYAQARDVLTGTAELDGLGRRLLLETLLQIKDTKSIASRFDPPSGSNEVIALMDALWSEGEKARLKALLNEALVASSADLSVVEMRKKYSARLK